ncbi:MAG: transketolase [Proteobacteria bacterium]|nr:transketolase [Pseudomonadota bacterium]
MTKTVSQLEQQTINTIRFLGIDAIQKANSGHPGMVMGAAPMAFVLWNRFLRFNPKNPNWFNRDRFILSAGHGSMLQYALLYLAGFDSVSLEDIKNFRQLDSSTPGHPENQVTPGVEVTTGPLGQGIGNAVGMAIAENHLAARFNKPDLTIVDHNIFTLLGDGCQMSGMSSESCSLAGHLGLGNLIALYDDNRISIDGSTDITFTEDVGKRFEAYGWHVQYVENGNTDLEAIAQAIEKAKTETTRPSLIRIHTTIGYGSPNKAGSSGSHGAPLGEEEIQATRENLGWELPPFSVPEEVLTYAHQAIEKGAKREAEWNNTLNEYKSRYPEDAASFEQLISGELPEGWEEALPTFCSDDKPDATRNLSGNCLNVLAQKVTGLIGGSADIAGSNKTTIKTSGFIQKGAFGNQNIHFGVREHGMGAICNGIALHNSGLIPYAATFMSFSDYMRGAIRVSAVSGAGTIFIMTHDSVAVGEDGPTHQPIEQITALRAIPNLVVIRPADGNETSGAYKVALKNRNRPTLLALTRQKVPNISNTSIDNVNLGAYVISDSDGMPDIILIGTGSELSLCVDASEKLKKDGVKVRVVSMPSFDLFEEQDQSYRESILPAAVTRRLSVEAGTSFGWYRYVGTHGNTISIDRCGTSAPGAICLEKFGFTVDNVLAKAQKLLG